MFAQSALRDTGQGTQIKLFGCWVLNVGQHGPAIKLYVGQYWPPMKIFWCLVLRSAKMVSMVPRLNYLGISFLAISVSMGLR